MREEKSTYVQEAWLRVFLKDKLIVLIPESDEETRELENWRAGHETHVFCATSQNRQALERTKQLARDP